MDKFVLTFDDNYENLFIDNTDDKEAHGDRLQTTLETTCVSKLNKVFPPMGKKSCNYWWSEEIS
jgi:hypothetical protein